ncbi:hypothetical protein HYX16_05825 [Candidatus Woesearchaeota archaeon]|nr:hypothetical protein [Candidatus Woesearchaeota archaeon]
MGKPKDGRGTLESLVIGEKGTREPDKRVYFLSEVAYDSDYFEQSEKNHKTYATLLKFLAADPELTGVVVDGALSRLERPEFLNEELTYWSKSLDDCADATKAIPNRQQYQHMAEGQFKILDKRLEELRRTLPKAKLVLNVFNDDVQYTASALVHEILVSAGGSKDELDKIRGGKAALTAKRTALKAEYRTLEDKPGMRDQRENIKRKITRVDHKLAAIFVEEGAKEEQVAIFTRPKKCRPIHQYTKQLVINELFDKYKEVCQKHKIELVTKDSVLDFKGFKIDYSHNRHDTWTPLKERHKNFADGTHGRAEDFEGLDAVVESGHHGKGHKTLQRLEISEPEINFIQWGAYNGEVSSKNITLFSVPPFEDQAELRKYLTGDKPERMGGGKPGGSTNHHAIKRLVKGGVSGLGMLRKDADGQVHSEMIFMQNFIDRSVLIQPDVYNIVGWTSDEHIGAKESLPILRDGFFALYKILAAENPVRVRGRPVRMVGYGSGGDTAENNAGNWPDKSHDMKDPHEVIRESRFKLSNLARCKPSELEDKIFDLSVQIASEASTGSVQSLRIIKDWVAEYYGRFLEENLNNKSRLEHVHVSTTGNHADSVQRRIGEKESDHFVRDVIKGMKLGVYEVGVRNPPKDARVYLGGGDCAHVLFMPNYGAAKDGGKPLFGPVRALLQHDPEQGEKGLDGAGASVTADIEMAGHTHEHYVKMVNAGDNKGRFSYRFGTINGVDPIQIRYASSVPRTQSAHAFTIPKRMELIEFTFPAYLLKNLGVAQLRSEGKEKKKTKN